MSVIPLLAAAARSSSTPGTQDDLRRLRRSRACAAPPSSGSGTRIPTTSSSCCGPSARRPGLVCMDGVNSMTGNAPGPARVRGRRQAPRCAPLRRRRARVRRHRRAAARRKPRLRDARQQHRPSLRRELRQPDPRRRLLEGVLVAAGVHRLPDDVKELLKVAASALPVLRALAGRLAGDGPRGVRRQRAARRCSCARIIWQHSARVVRVPRASSASRPRTTPGFPIIEVPLARSPQDRRGRRSCCSIAASTSRWRHIPLVPKDEVGFRIQLTAANTDAEVDTLLAAIEELAADGEPDAQLTAARRGGPEDASGMSTSTSGIRGVLAGRATAAAVAGVSRRRRG